MVLISMINVAPPIPHALAAAVLDEQADLGIAFDGDGDRVLFIDAMANGRWR